MKIFIGASSKKFINDKYTIEASDIATNLANSGYDLIIGGVMKDGMLGRIYEAFSECKRNITVNTLKEYNEDFTKYPEYTKNYYKTTFDRTIALYNMADVILLLPGGTGTMAELFSMLEEHRTIKSQKEIIIYNQDGYYYKILELIMDMIKNKFNDPDILSNIKVFNEQTDLIKYLKNKIKKEA